MKRIFILIFCALTSIISFAQFNTFTFLDTPRGLKSELKKLLLNEIKEHNQIRIKNGHLQGFDIWETMNAASKIEFILVHSYSDLNNMHKSRSLSDNLKLSSDESEKLRSTWRTCTTDNTYRIVTKSIAFRNKLDKLPNIARINMFKTVNNKMRTKWIEGHKKFADIFITGNNDAWGSASVIFKPYRIKYNHITVDFSDSKNLASYLMEKKVSFSQTDDFKKYWTDSSGKRIGGNKIRTMVNQVFAKKLSIIY